MMVKPKEKTKKTPHKEFELGLLLGEAKGRAMQRELMQTTAVEKEKNTKRSFELLFNQIFFGFMFVGNIIWFGLIFGTMLNTAKSNIIILWILLFAMNIYLSGLVMFKNGGLLESHLKK